jgi:CBS-domain-containing membrane protein
VLLLKYKLVPKELTVVGNIQIPRLQNKNKNKKQFMQVKDLMTKEVICVRADAKINEVSQLLTGKSIHGLPVLDSNDLIAGIITESDFFIKDIPDLYLPSYIELLKKGEYAKRLDGEEKHKISKLLEARASDIMTPDPITVRADTDINDVIKIIKERHLFTLPVVDDQKKAIGIITLADIIVLLK